MSVPWRLAGLGLRRTAPLRFALPLALFAGWCAWRAARAFARSGELVGPGTSVGALVRPELWALAGLLVLPLVLGRGALVARLWNRADSEWLGAKPLAHGVSRALLCGGAWLGIALWIAGGALLVELACPAAPSAARFVASLASPPVVLAEGAPALTVELSDACLAAPAEGACLWLRPSVAPGSGPAVGVRARLADADGASTTLEQRLHGRAVLELALPPGARGPFVLTLERAGPGAVFVLPRGAIELVERAASERLASLALGLAAWLALGAWFSLAAGLGAWMRPGLAGALACLGFLAPWVWASARPLLPGADLARAFELVGRGLVPEAPSAHGVLVDLAGVLLGFLCLELGLRERRTP